MQKELKGVEEKVVMDTDYADDMAVMDNTEGRLQDLLTSLLTTALMLG